MSDIPALGASGKRKEEEVSGRINYRDLLRKIVLGELSIEKLKILFVGICPRCRKKFRKKRVDQIYDRELCKKEHTRKP